MSTANHLLLEEAWTKITYCNNQNNQLQSAAFTALLHCCISMWRPIRSTVVTIPLQVQVGLSHIESGLREKRHPATPPSSSLTFLSSFSPWAFWFFLGLLGTHFTPSLPRIAVFHCLDTKSQRGFFSATHHYLYWSHSRPHSTSSNQRYLMSFIFYTCRTLNEYKMLQPFPKYESWKV